MNESCDDCTGRDECKWPERATGGPCSGFIPRHKPARRKAAKPKITITVVPVEELDGGFAGYLEGTVGKPSGALVVLNIGSIGAACAEHDIPHREVMVDCIAHEVYHALQEWYGLAFDEAKTEAMLAREREKMFGESKPNATTRKTFDATDDARELVPCEDAEDMFKKLGIEGQPATEEKE